MVIYDDVVFGKNKFALGVTYGSESYEGMVEVKNDLDSSRKSGGQVGKTQVGDALDLCGWPLAVPTVILGAVGSKLIVGVFFEK